MRQYLNTSLAVFLLLSIFFSACEEKKSVNRFQQDGVSFIMPEFWKITELDNKDSSFFFMALSKQGHGASADAIIEWNNGEFELDTILASRQKDYTNQDVFKKGNITFSDPEFTQFSKYKSLTSKFNFTALDVKYIGQIYCFYVPTCNKTFMIVFQQVAADNDKQKEDFLQIENSFLCNL
jgi:hypothetical protein